MTESQTESQIQTAILKWLRSSGLFHWRVPLGPVKHGGVRKKNPMRGHPDIAGVTPNGHYFAIEVKDEKGLLSDSQVEWFMKAASNNVIAFVARHLDDVTDHLGEYVKLKA